ncbi:TetR/AcrR family transcriptional regulator [Leekyejoonella antrihumi]|uniref:TetR/AcrR family transcriptional regulator n=1 Tax=Leekyejoonella antrihumi TaxID=1660198 RepID=A0A563E9D2_9MICO|nr:TetR/AcrR family transcriptional regulator [Leekyejoonella antrihumi]TWP38929.1 TetR/AcrR family transcriptional regulator [Leekyejoonella antrihumi]
MTSQGWSVRSKLDREGSPTHAALVGAARRCFEQKGFGPTTIADIAKAAQVGRATFYVYFATKDEIFSVLAQQLHDDLVASQDPPGFDLSDPVATARASIGAYLDAYTRNLRLISVLQHQSLADQQMSRLWEQVQDHPLHRSARFARRLADQGLAQPAAAPEAIARAAGGMVSAFASHVVDHPQDAERAKDELGEMFIRLLGLG